MLYNFFVSILFSSICTTCKRKKCYSASKWFYSEYHLYRKLLEWVSVSVQNYYKDATIYVYNIVCVFIFYACICVHLLAKREHHSVVLNLFLFKTFHHTFGYIYVYSKLVLPRQLLHLSIDKKFIRVRAPNAVLVTSRFM